MKQLLKPTGQILTTAVVTSTAIDAHFPQAANPLSVESASPETTPTPEQPTIDASDVSDQGETVAPPEAVPTHSALPGQMPSGRILQDERLTPLPPEFFVDLAQNTDLDQKTVADGLSDAPSETTGGQRQVNGTSPPSMPPIPHVETIPVEYPSPRSQPKTSPAQEEVERSLALPTTQVFLPEASVTIPSAPTPEPSDDIIESDTTAPHSAAPDIASSMPLPTELPTKLPTALTEAPAELATERSTEPPTDFPSQSPQDQDSDVQAVPASRPSTFHPSSPDVPVVNQQWLAPPDTSVPGKDMADEAELTMPLAESTLETSGDESVIESISADRDRSVDIVDGTMDVDIVDGALDVDIVDGALERVLPEDESGSAIDEPDIANLEPISGGSTFDPDINENTDELSTPPLPHSPTSPEATLIEGEPLGDDSDKLQETRDWLDDQLATIVDQSRQRQAHQNRQQLIDYARRSLELGNIAEARQVAENAVLSEEERDALSVAIDEATVHEFIPLIPLDHTNNDLDLIGIQPTSPAWDALPTLPTTPLSPPNPIQASSIIASSSERLPSLPLSPSGLHQWPLNGLPSASSLTAEELKNCLVGDADLQIETVNDVSIETGTDDERDELEPESAVDEAAIRDVAQMKSVQTNHTVMEPMSYIGTGQQPPSGLKTSDAFPVGADFLAGVGQQPPSILPESSWSGTPVLSADPVPLKWTRSRLNQELDAIATTPKTLSPDCDEALSSRNNPRAVNMGANMGGRTVASLTGYEWLSQYAVPRPESAQQQRRPLHMILPLPHAVPMTSGFGWRSHPIYGGRRFHFGLDYGAPSGTPILASIPGRIQSTGSLAGYGLTVVLENSDVEYRNLYAHMSGIAVEEGTWVEQGTVIGWVGSTGNSTGPHLHFEVHKQSPEGWVAIDPLQAAAEMIRLAQR